MLMRAHSMSSAPGLPSLPLHDRMWKAARRIGQYILRCEEAYAAAALYQELSRFSNAELERRGIGRGDLHRHVFERLGH
jgi:hypothetical protein